MLRKGLTDEDWIPTPDEQREIASAIARERQAKLDRVRRYEHDRHPGRAAGRHTRYTGPFIAEMDGPTIDDLFVRSYE